MVVAERSMRRTLGEISKLAKRRARVGDLFVPHTSGALWLFVRFQDEGCDMATRSLALASIFDGVPSHIPEVAHLHGSRGLEHHQHPLVDWIDHHGELALFLLLDGFPHPCSRAFLPPLVDDGSKRRIYPVPLSPFARQPVEVSRLRVWARIEVELELGVEFRVEVGWSQPVVLPIVAIADVELVFSGWEILH